MVWSHPSRTKVHVDHAGPSLLLDLCNLTGTFLVKEEILPSPNSNWLIVPVILIIMDVMEDYHHMPSNTSDTPSMDLNQIRLIPMLLRQIPAFIDHQLELLMLGMEAITLPKEMKKN